jgi:hypothetical protein
MTNIQDKNSNALNAGDKREKLLYAGGFAITYLVINQQINV